MGWTKRLCGQKGGGLALQENLSDIVSSLTKNENMLLFMNQRYEVVITYILDRLAH